MSFSKVLVDQWTSGPTMNFSNVAPFSISPQSGNFTAAAVVDPGVLNTTFLGVLIMLRDSNENLLALYGTLPEIDLPTTPNLTWINVTEEFSTNSAEDITNTTDCTFSNLAPTNDRYYTQIACPSSSTKTGTPGPAWEFIQGPSNTTTNSEPPTKT